MKLLRLAGWTAAALAVLTLSSCNRGSGRTKVAFVTNNSYAFWTIAQRGTEQAAKEFDVEAEFKMPGDGSAQTQRRIIEDLLTKGIQGIAVSPNDAANSADFYREISARVPLVTQDSDVPDIKARRCYIGTDNYKAGKAAGVLVKQAAPDGGKVMIYVGKLDAQNAKERRQGVLDELAGRKDATGEEDGKTFGKWTVLGTMTDDAQADKCRGNVDDTLTKNPDVKVLVGLWEYNPPAMLGAVKAAKQEGKVAIVGFDENDETLQGIKDGYVIGTIVQNPFMFGYEAIKILAGLARGDESVLKRPDIDDKGQIFVPHRVITKSNVEEFHTELKRLTGR